jgi:hypothetical protein
MQEFFDNLAKSFMQLEPMAQNVLIGIGALLALIIVAVLIARARQRPSSEAELESAAYDKTMMPPVPPAPQPPPPLPQGPVMIAEMVEENTLTGFGGFCVVLMIFTWIVAVFVFASAKSAPQETVALLIWIGGNTMFGVGALLNQQKRYKIYK